MSRPKDGQWRWIAAAFVALCTVGIAAAEELPGIGPARETVVPGKKYEKGGLYRFLFGADYRDLWTTPISLPVLDLRVFAGGLTPVTIVGHGQSKGLALKGADGRSYTFRPLIKDPRDLLPEELRESKAKAFLEDQMASGHPAGHTLLGPLMDAVGILHNDPKIVLMPDDPALGEFRKQFGGAAGDIEEYSGTPGFGGALETVDGEEMWNRLRESPAVRADARTYLAARLVDQLVGDWDRHRNQWRWARLQGRDAWQPIPEDRDQAFVRFEGAALTLIRPTLPLLVKFGKDYSNLEGLTFDGWDVDKRLLAELDKQAWDAVARDVRAALTDEVLDRAVGLLPPEYAPKDAARLLAGLKARRDGLLEQADRFYRFLSGSVDVFCTDQAEQVSAVRDPTGDLELSVTAAGSPQPYFRRLFRKAETDEVRVYLHGGDDQVTLSGGPKGGVLLRVIGGDGRDVLDDSQGGGTRFSSADADDHVISGPGTHWDKRRYHAPPPNKSGEWIPPRDWGRRTIPMFRLTYEPDLGGLANAALLTTGYSFREHPYADRQLMRLSYSTKETAFRGYYDGDFRSENSRRRLGLIALASGLEVQRFFGFGNETTIEGDPDDYKVDLHQYALAPSLGFSLGSAVDLQVGPIAKYSDTLESANPVLGAGPLYGEGQFGQVGGALSLRVDTTGSEYYSNRGLPFAFPERGLRLDVAGTVFPAVWDVESTFGKVYGDARLFLTPRGSWRPTLVLATGGQKVFGTAPYFESAFLGGRVRLGRYEPGSQGAVRGLRPQRYAGDASLYGSADLFLPVTRTSFLGVPLQFGVQGFGDAGRVYVEGQSSDTWHHGFGGGVYFASPGRRNLFSFSLARSEGRTVFYLRAGLAL